MKKDFTLNKSKIVFVVLFVIIISCLTIFMISISVKSYKSSVLTTFDNDKKEVVEDTITLGKYVLTTKDVNLYEKVLDKYTIIGSIGKNIILEIVDKNGDYYRIQDINEEVYYVKRNNLVNYDDVVEVNDSRYKKYIVFNVNVVTQNKTSFYDEFNNLIYSIDKGYSLPLIIKDDYRYGVEFNNRLLYIKKDESQLIENKNTDLENTRGIGVLNYHFFYDDAIKEEITDCRQEICASKSQFKMHLDYIKENDFLTLKMEELEWYIDGKIQLPKSVVITIDDGWRADLGIKMLNEYQMYGTLFLVTSWIDPNAFISDYVEIHSHSDNMHNVGDCPNGQGGGIQCLPRETILNDLKLSSQKLGGSTVFCYPFYEYNDYSISVLKEAGYKMAFAGESWKSDNLVKVGSDKYRLPRFVVVNYTTMKTLKNYLEH